MHIAVIQPGTGVYQQISSSLKLDARAYKPLITGINQCIEIKSVS